MELPKRARTVNWESGVLTLDGEKQFEVPELTTEIMEQLAAYTLVGFHVKGYPVTDELLVPFAGHKSMANFGVEAAWSRPTSSSPVRLRVIRSSLQPCKADRPLPWMAALPSNSR